MTESYVAGFGTRNEQPEQEVAGRQAEPDPEPSPVQVEPGIPAEFIGRPPPANLERLIEAKLVVGQGGRPWQNGEYAILPESTQCYWTGLTWVEGVAPSPV